MPRTREEIRRSFQALRWHDSELRGLELRRLEPEGRFDLVIQVHLIERPIPGGFEYRDRRITFGDCRFLKTSLDLLGLRHCGGVIGAAWCPERSELRDEVARHLEDFDLPQPEDPMEGLLHFSIYLCPPSGTIDIFASDWPLE